jgi:uncharacterized protein (TIGR03905 family)
MKYTFKPKGVCSIEIQLDVENGIINDVKFVGGCNGNTQGVAALCRGRKTDEVIKLLSGINCGGRGTSCPDQLAKALTEIKGK